MASRVFKGNKKLLYSSRSWSWLSPRPSVICTQEALEQILWEAGEAEDRQEVAAAGSHLLAWEPSCGLAQGLLGVPSGVAEA